MSRVYDKKESTLDEIIKEFKAKKEEIRCVCIKEMRDKSKEVERSGEPFAPLHESLALTVSFPGGYMASELLDKIRTWPKFQEFQARGAATRRTTSTASRRSRQSRRSRRSISSHAPETRYVSIAPAPPRDSPAQSVGPAPIMSIQEEYPARMAVRYHWDLYGVSQLTQYRWTQIHSRNKIL